MSANVSVYIGDEIGKYGFPGGHPFGPHRMGVFWDESIRLGHANLVQVETPVMATREELLTFHTPDYVAKVEEYSNRGSGLLDRGDTPAFPGVWEAAGHVVGSALDAMERILDGRCRRAFVPIAGLHHAARAMASGFCVFNDCGVVIETLRAKHGIQRVAYVDIDAHHGDGVFYAFEEDPDLIFADLHEDGRFLYPGTGHVEETGKGAAEGTKLNVPMPPHADDAAFFKVWPVVETYLEKAAPEFIILQCGADSIAGDPVTHMNYSRAAHLHAAASLTELAEKHCDGRILAVGGGGYNNTNIAQGWNAVLSALIEVPTKV